MLLISSMIATLTLAQIEPYPHRTDLPPVEPQSDGSILVPPETAMEMARELAYCDTLPGECNKQLDELENNNWRNLGVSAIVVGSLAAGVFLGSPELAAAAIGGAVVLTITW